MKIKKIVIVSLILLSLSLTLSAINAAEFEDVKVEGNSLSIHNIKFNMPDGYTLDNSTKTETCTSCTLFDKDVNLLLISVNYGSDYSNFLSNVKDNEKKTIKNHEGKYEKTADSVTFECIEDNCHVIIITDPDKENLIEEALS